MSRIYLDNAATTAIDPEVLEAMMPYMTSLYGNPSSTHEEGRLARLAVETSRQKVARLLNCHPSEIYFTSGGTESNNLALRAAVKDLGITHIVTSKIEHHAVLKTVQSLQANNGITVNYVNLKPDASIDMKHLNQLLRSLAEKNVMVTLMHANNELGNLVDLEEVGEMCNAYGCYHHSDTVQTVGHYQLDIQRLKVQMMSASAHKFHGPKGIGMLYIKSGLGLNGIITGGGQEKGVRAGTENVAGIVGFSKALEMALFRLETDRAHITKLKNRLIDFLTSLKIPVNGALGDKSLYTVVNASFPNDSRCETLLMDLDIAGIAASGGSACSAGNGGSHVIEAIGKSPFNNIRFSMSRNNTVDEINELGRLIRTYFA